MPYVLHPNNVIRSKRTKYRWESKFKRVKPSTTTNDTTPAANDVDFESISENEAHSDTISQIDNNTDNNLENALDNETASPTLGDGESIDRTTSNETANYVTPVSNINQVDEDDNEGSHENSSVHGLPLGHKIKSIFRHWGIKHKITRQAGNDLLEILRDEEVRSNLQELPKGWKAVRRIPKLHQRFNPNICQKAGGEYAYLGVEQNLKSGNNFFFDPNEDTISLSVNVDGVPLMESSKSTFYPLLGKCGEANVFMIALWHSQDKSKPTDHNEFLMDFVRECKYLEDNGLDIYGKHYNFEIKNIICDAIAKAPLLNIKGPTGYFSCPKCSVMGQKIQKIIPGKRKRNGEMKTCCSNTYFLDVNASKREHEHFYSLSSGVDGDSFFHGHTILRELKSLDLVRDVVVDSMHKVYLGTGRRLLDALLDGYVDFSSDKRRKSVIRGSDKEMISRHLDYLRKGLFCPSDFARKPRNLDVKSFWKTTELRQFILYTSAPILKNYLPEEHFHLITTFIVAIRILSTYNGLNLNTIEYAGKLIDMFIETCAQIFGDSFIVHVVHMLHHLPEDVKMFGILQDFSAFPFEDFNFLLTRNIKSGNRPLEQMLRGYNEMVDACMFKKKDFNNGCVEVCSPNCIKVGTTLYRSDRPGDRYCSIQGKNSIKIIQIESFTKRDDHVLVTGKPFRKLGSLFHYPCDSKRVNMFKCKSQFLPPIEFTAAQITGKYYPVPHSCNNEKFTMVKILHH